MLRCISIAINGRICIWFVQFTNHSPAYKTSHKYITFLTHTARVNYSDFYIYIYREIYLLIGYKKREIFTDNKSQMVNESLSLNENVFIHWGIAEMKNTNIMQFECWTHTQRIWKNSIWIKSFRSTTPCKGNAK